MWVGVWWQVLLWLIDGELSEREGKQKLFQPSGDLRYDAIRFSQSLGAIEK